MVDQEGADVLEQMETTNYANAGNEPVMGRPIQQQNRPVDDERMPEEWNRARNKEGEVVGFIGHRPIIRSKENEEVPMEGSEATSLETSSGVMAALARLRQQENS